MELTSYTWPVMFRLIIQQIPPEPHSLLQLVVYLLFSIIVVLQEVLSSAAHLAADIRLGTLDFQETLKLSIPKWLSCRRVRTIRPQQPHLKVIRLTV